MTQHVTKAGSLGIVLAFLLPMSPCALGDILITTSGKHWEGTVGEAEDHFVLRTPNGGSITFPKNVVREVIEQEAREDRGVEQGSEKNLEVEQFLRGLRSKNLAARRRVIVARSREKETYRQRCRRITKPDPDAVKRAKAILKKMREAIAYMKRTGANGAQIVQKQMIGDTQLGSDLPIWIITRSNAVRALARAERDVRDAARSKKVPPELRLRHRTVLELYDAALKLVLKSQSLVRKAEPILTAAGDNPDLLAREKERWGNAITDSLEQVDEALTFAKAGHDPVGRTQGIEPLGYYVVRARPLARESRLVIVVRCRSDRLIPSEAEYRKIAGDFGGTFAAVPRDHVRACEASRFHLVREDGRGWCASGICEWYESGVGSDYSSIWILADRESVPPPAVTLALYWDLDSSEFGPPFDLRLLSFKVKFDGDSPVWIPDKRFNPPRKTHAELSDRQRRRQGCRP